MTSPDDEDRIGIFWGYAPNEFPKIEEEFIRKMEDGEIDPEVDPVTGDDIFYGPVVPPEVTRETVLDMELETEQAFDGALNVEDQP